MLAHTQLAKVLDFRQEDIAVEFLTIFYRKENRVQLSDSSQIVLSQGRKGNLGR